MTPRLVSLPLFALVVALAAAPAVHAGTPGPTARRGFLGLGVCEGGARAGEPCVDAFDCDDEHGAPGVCPTPVSEVAVRGILTLIADKDSGRWQDVTAVPETRDAAGHVVPTDFSRSTLSMILEFTHEGRRYGFAETFQDLGDFVDPALSIDCRGFCVPTWREPAVEHRIATPNEETDQGGGGGTGGGGGAAGSPGVRITWATPPPAMGQQILEALGLPSDATPFLEVVNTTAIFDHSAEQDPLASVRRFKVTIRVKLAEPSESFAP